MKYLWFKRRKDLEDHISSTLGIERIVYNGDNFLTSNGSIVSPTQIPNGFLTLISTITFSYSSMDFIDYKLPKASLELVLSRISETHSNAFQLTMQENSEFNYYVDTIQLYKI